MSEEIKIEICQPSNIDITFTKPAFHFGQVLVDKAENENGVVVGMLFCDDTYVGWEYTLFYPDLGNYGRSIREQDLEIVVTVKVN